MEKSIFYPGNKVVCHNRMSALYTSPAVVIKSDNQGVLLCWLHGNHPVVSYPWDEVDNLQFHPL